MNNFPLCWLR